MTRQVLLIVTASLLAQHAIAEECPPSSDIGTYEGPVPDWAEVEVDEQWVRLTFQWDKDPHFETGRAAEFSVNVDGAGEYLRPFDGDDLNPNVGFWSTLPCAYRDVYNNSAGTAQTVYEGLTEFCGMPEGKTTKAMAEALYIAIAVKPDKAAQFSVGSKCPENIVAGVPYYAYYRVKKNPAYPAEKFGYAWILHDTVHNTGCPLTIGDPLGFLIDKGDGPPPRWINRLCVPTSKYHFIPRNNNTCPYSSSICKDNDKDLFFGIVDPPTYGTFAGDCDESKDWISNTLYQAETNSCPTYVPCPNNLPTGWYCAKRQELASCVSGGPQDLLRLDSTGFSKWQSCEFGCVPGSTLGSDSCTPDPCSNQSQSGQYCASTLLGPDADTKLLYTCSNQEMTAKEICKVKCVPNPTGTPDVCCGDGECLYETAGSCYDDCHCGDGTCKPGSSESCSTCSKDCCLPAPDLKTPLDGKIFPYSDIVHFTWDAVPQGTLKAHRYKLAICPDSTLNSPACQFYQPPAGVTEYYVTVSFAPGKYYWGVTAIPKDEAIGWGATNVRSFLLQSLCKACVPGQCGTTDGCGNPCPSCKLGIETCVNKSCVPILPPPTGKDCTSGPCCDLATKKVLPKGVKCGAAKETFACDGTCAGTLTRTTEQSYCDGDSPACTGPLGQAPKVDIVLQCNCDQKCDAANLGCFQSASCATYPSWHPDGTLVKSTAGPETYLLRNGKKEYIPNVTTTAKTITPPSGKSFFVTYTNYHFNSLAWVVTVSPQELATYPLGPEYAYKFSSYSLFSCNDWPCESGQTYFGWSIFGYSLKHAKVSPAVATILKKSWSTEVNTVGEKLDYYGPETTGPVPLHPGTLAKKGSKYYLAGFNFQIFETNLSEADLKLLGYEPQYDTVDLGTVSITTFGTIAGTLTKADFGSSCAPSDPPNSSAQQFGGGGITVVGIKTGDPCYTGYAPTKNVGACKGGTWLVSDSGNELCLGEVLPSSEICSNGTDDDCDGEHDSLDPDCYSLAPLPADADGDGYPEDVDCDDSNVLVHPDAEELCNGKDDNCNWAVDESFPELGKPCDGPDDDLCKNGTSTCAPSGTAVQCANESPWNIVETCNFIDDDCDGATDEGLQNACGTCGIEPPDVCFDGIDNNCNGAIDEDCGDCGPDGTACDDGVPCTTGDTCHGGVCEGEPLDALCSDGNGCTTDVCNPKGGCISIEMAAQCEDGDPCTGPDYCQAGACTSGPDICPDCTTDTECPLPDQCAARQCSAGVCIVVPLTGTPCSDAIPCTTGDLCSDGICKGVPQDTLCSDGNLCTLDTCVAGAGCKITPLSGTTCDDQDDCTVGDTCTAGACSGSVSPACVDADNDGSPASSDCDDLEPGIHPGAAELCDGIDNNCTGGIDEGCGECASSPDGTPCTPDSNSCTTDICQAGSCSHTALPDGSPCSDTDACTTSDQCTSGICQGVPVICNDGNACTADACDPLGFCLYTAKGGAQCSDGNACTVADTCSNAGACIGTPKVCDDGNPCTTDGCGPTGACSYTPTSGTACSDNNACTTNDTCANGTCSGAPISCSDGNVCTTDACSPTNGACIHTDNLEPCDDGDACTVSDACSGGACHGIPTASCDLDGDGFSPVSGDCDDTEEAVYPGAPELCDGLDNDCDGPVDEGCPATGIAMKLSADTTILLLKAEAFDLVDGTSVSTVVYQEHQLCAIGWATGEEYWLKPGGFADVEVPVTDSDGDGWVEYPLPPLRSGDAPYAGCCAVGGAPFHFTFKRCGTPGGDWLALAGAPDPRVGDFYWQGVNPACACTGSLTVSYDSTKGYWASGSALTVPCDPQDPCQDGGTLHDVYVEFTPVGDEDGTIGTDLCDLQAWYEDPLQTTWSKPCSGVHPRLYRLNAKMSATSWACGEVTPGKPLFSYGVPRAYVDGQEVPVYALHEWRLQQGCNFFVCPGGNCEFCCDGVDNDGDGLVDAADENCSDAIYCANGPTCGNAVCGEGESCYSCSVDCGNCPAQCSSTPANGCKTFWVTVPPNSLATKIQWWDEVGTPILPDTSIPSSGLVKKQAPLGACSATLYTDGNPFPTSGPDGTCFLCGTGSTVTSCALPAGGWGCVWNGDCK